MATERPTPVSPELRIGNMRSRELVENLATADERELIGNFRAGFRSPFPHVTGHSIPVQENRAVLGYQLHRFTQENSQTARVVAGHDTEGNPQYREVLRYALAGETALYGYEGEHPAARFSDADKSPSRIQMISFFNELPTDFPSDAAACIAMSASGTSDSHIGNSHTFGTLVKYIDPADYRIIVDSARTVKYKSGMGPFEAVALHPASLLVSSLAKDQMRGTVAALEPRVSGFTDRVLGLLESPKDIEEWITVAGATASSLNCIRPIKTGVFDRATTLIEKAAQAK